MILVHAPGGGLGHLTRVLAAHHTLGWSGPVIVLSSSTRTDELPLPPGMTVRRIPRDVAGARGPLRAWLLAQIEDVRPDELWIDALPAGMWGEIDGALLAVLGDRPVHHLARLVRWPAYERANVAPRRPPRFASAVVTERLPHGQDAWIRAHAAAVATVGLVDPPTGGAADASCAIAVADGSWLVVHAGADDEIAHLVGHALDHRAADAAGRGRPVVLCTPRPSRRLRELLPVDVEVVPAVPAWPLFARAHCVVAAAGANTVRQVLASGAAHRLVPLPRRWDDQFARARHARETLGRTFPLPP